LGEPLGTQITHEEFMKNFEDQISFISAGENLRILEKVLEINLALMQS
jgi:hypothetical protein